MNGESIWKWDWMRLARRSGHIKYVEASMAALFTRGMYTWRGLTSPPGLRTPGGPCKRTPGLLQTAKGPIYKPSLKL